MSNPPQKPRHTQLANTHTPTPVVTPLQNRTRMRGEHTDKWPWYLAAYVQRIAIMHSVLGASYLTVNNLYPHSFLVFQKIITAITFHGKNRACFLIYVCEFPELWGDFMFLLSVCVFPELWGEFHGKDAWAFSEKNLQRLASGMHGRVITTCSSGLLSSPC